MMRRIVLIDGENLVYGLRTLLGAGGSMAQRDEVASFNYRGMIDELLSDNLPLQIFWFGARLRRYDANDELLEKSELAIRMQSRFVNHIQSQGIQFVKVGYLRAREVEPCAQCGHTQWKLAEKGVDVGLAVRMVGEASADTELVVISADTDLLPAFIAAKKHGAHIVHIGYEYRPSLSLSSMSHISRVITLPMATKYR